jgi:hypothetical protein
MWYPAVPHDWALNFAPSPFSRQRVVKIASASGDRQILPRQTNSIFILFFSKNSGY